MPPLPWTARGVLSRSTTIPVSSALFSSLLLYSSVPSGIFFLLFGTCSYIVQHNQASTFECTYQLYDDKPHGWMNYKNICMPMACSFKHSGLNPALAWINSAFQHFFPSTSNVGTMSSYSALCPAARIASWPSSSGFLFPQTGASAKAPPFCLTASSLSRPLIPDRGKRTHTCH